MTVLFAYDGSAGAEHAISEASRLLGARVGDAIVLSVWEPVVVESMRIAALGAGHEPIVPSDAAAVDRSSEQHARTLSEQGAALARDAGFQARAVAVGDAHDVAGAILAAATQAGAELIVLGARGLSGLRALLGSVSTRVAERADVPVLVIHHPASRRQVPRADQTGPGTDEVPKTD